MPDDEVLNSLSPTMLSWLAAQISQDEEDEFEKELAFTEYLASFISPEKVEKVKSHRANRKTTGDKEFQELVSKISNRAPPKFQEK